MRGPQTGPQLGKGAQRIQGRQGVKTGNVTIQNKKIQINRTIQSKKTIQTNKNIQGNRIQGARTTSPVQAVNAGEGNKGSNKNAGKLKKH